MVTSPTATPAVKITASHPSGASPLASPSRPMMAGSYNGGSNFRSGNGFRRPSRNRSHSSQVSNGSGNGVPISTSPGKLNVNAAVFVPGSSPVVSSSFGGPASMPLMSSSFGASSSGISGGAFPPTTLKLLNVPENGAWKSVLERVSSAVNPDGQPHPYVVSAYRVVPGPAQERHAYLQLPSPELSQIAEKCLQANFGDIEVISDPGSGRGSPSSSPRGSADDCDGSSESATRSVASSAVQRVFSEKDSTLVLKNLHFQFRSSYLSSLLRSMGIPARSVKYHMDSQKQSFRGIAFVKYSSLEDAEKAFDILSGTHIMGRRIRVEYRRKLPHETGDSDDILDSVDMDNFSDDNDSSTLSPARANAQGTNDSQSFLESAAEDSQKFRKALEDFKHDDTQRQLSYSSALDARLRKLVHCLCEELGLFSLSRGHGQSRYVSVWKDKALMEEEQRADRAAPVMRSRRGTATSTSGSGGMPGGAGGPLAFHQPQQPHFVGAFHHHAGNGAAGPAANATRRPLAPQFNGVNAGMNNNSSSSSSSPRSRSGSARQNPRQRARSGLNAPVDPNSSMARSLDSASYDPIVFRSRRPTLLATAAQRSRSSSDAAGGNAGGNGGVVMVHARGPGDQHTVAFPAGRGYSPGLVEKAKVVVAAVASAPTSESLLTKSIRAAATAESGKQ